MAVVHGREQHSDTLASSDDRGTLTKLHVLWWVQMHPNNFKNY
jgi:hypothetical protein